MSRDNIKEAFEKGITGVIVYDETEDSYQLDIGKINLGLQNSSHWQDYEGMKVKVTIIVEETK
jgi:hypothetical protein